MADKKNRKIMAVYSCFVKKEWMCAIVCMVYVCVWYLKLYTSQIVHSLAIHLPFLHKLWYQECSFLALEL